MTILGRFLEVAIDVDSAADGVERFRALGFEELGTIDVLAEPYAAVWDGRITVGLHVREQAGTALTFVRPELKAYLRAFRRCGIEPSFARLADDEFHQLGLVDPNGQRLVLDEARTYSPADWRPEAVPPCGEFLEYSLQTPSLEASTDFWCRLGLEVGTDGEAPHRWARLAGSGLALGLHECAPFTPGLTFRAANFEARCEYLRALGNELTMDAPVAVDTRRAATLAALPGLAIYLVGEPAE